MNGRRLYAACRERDGAPLPLYVRLDYARVYGRGPSGLERLEGQARTRAGLARILARLARARRHYRIVPGPVLSALPDGVELDRVI